MLNRIDIMGRLTRDPKLRHTQSGKAVAGFTLAVDRDYAPKNGDKETDFIDVVVWEQKAEFVCKYFAKGSMAIVSGRLQIRPWEDKDGNKRKTAEIVASEVYFGSSKKSEDGSGNTYAQKGYSSGGYSASGGRPASSNPPAYSNGPAGDSGGFEDLGETDDGDLPF